MFDFVCLRQTKPRLELPSGPQVLSPLTPRASEKLSWDDFSLPSVSNYPTLCRLAAGGDHTRGHRSYWMLSQCFPIAHGTILYGSILYVYLCPTIIALAQLDAPYFKGAEVTTPTCLLSPSYMARI